MADVSSQTSLFKGFIDVMSAETVRGWVIDLRQPEQPVRLEMLIDGEPVARGVAGNRRPDVHAAGMPSESVGFQFRIPLSVRDGKRHRIAFRTEDGEPIPLDDSVSVSQTEFQIELPAVPGANSPPPALMRGRGVIGTVTRLNPDTLVAATPVAPTLPTPPARTPPPSPPPSPQTTAQPTPQPNPQTTTQPNTRTDRDIILASDLFDPAWYLARYKDVARSGADPLDHYLRFGSKEGRNPGPRFNTTRYVTARGDSIPPDRNPLAHYIEHGNASDLVDIGLLTPFQRESVTLGIDRLRALPLFNEDEYLTLNADIRDPKIDIVNHAMAYGFSEGRSVFRKDRVAVVLGRLNREDPAALPPPGKGAARKLPRIGVFHNSTGNQFIHDLANDLAAALRLAGQDAVVLDETSDIAARPPICVFVAPHEFFHLGAGRNWVTDDVIRNAVMFNTEQPQTIWFERAMPFILMSRGVIDICQQVFRIFQDSSLPALHFNPHVPDIAEPWLTEADQNHPLVQILPRKARPQGNRETPIEDRPIDVSFFGTSSPARESFFVRNARYFAAMDCYLYYRRFKGPLTKSERDSVLVRLAGHVATHSKITLNIHRDSYGFFEWHRIVKLGMACGSLVVSEPCLPHPVFRPNIHYFEETGRHIPNLIDWLLKSADGQAAADRARKAVASLIRNRTAARNIGRGLADFLGRVTETAR